MPFDTGIANRLRDAALKVVEVDGWRTRGSSSFSPKGSVDHHTADGPGNHPSLGIVTNGRPGLSGPLCNVLIGRDNTCFVVAAGRANHAGEGSWKGLRYNSSVYGIERENKGYAATDPWRADQTEVAARAHAALIRGISTAEYVCGHREWTTRKIDAHSVDYNHFRGRVAYYLNTPQPEPQPPLPEEDDMYGTQVEIPNDDRYHVYPLPVVKGNGFGTNAAFWQFAVENPKAELRIAVFVGGAGWNVIHDPLVLSGNSDPYVIKQDPSWRKVSFLNKGPSHVGWFVEAGKL